MMEGARNTLTTIDTLVRRRQPFAVYRLPGASAPHLLTQQTGQVRAIYDLSELNGARGFVIAPFCVSGSCPAVLIRPDRSETVCFAEEGADAGCDAEPQPDEPVSETSTEAYAACFHLFMNALRDRRFDKLVLSRRLTVSKAADFSPAAIFRAACKRYLHSYTYLCYTPQTGVWLGSTPEILLAGEGTEWHTVALAGTQPLQDGRLPQEWDGKNRREQAYVADYIRSRLLSRGIRPTESGPYPAYAGALSHLKTDFRFSLERNTELGDLLKLLHPTPAVCGLPKEEAYRFILQNEAGDRRYYSGFIGWLDPEGRSDLYVNLRCMHIGDEQLTLYAGGGLLASSELEAEWVETEKKLQTIKRLVTAPSH